MLPKVCESAPHPSADVAEDLILSGNFDKARTALNEALSIQPHHPDLLAAQGLLYLYNKEEDRAIDLVGRARFGPRARKLAKLLAEHLVCRQKLALKTGARDPMAHAFLTKVRMSVDRALDPVGVDVSIVLLIREGATGLNRTLKSIRGVGDELFIVDCFPGEETSSIAAREGAHYLPTQAVEMEPALNRVLNAARGHWVLWLECGEELDYESRSAIESAVIRPQYAGYQIQTLAADSLPQGHKTRLFRKDSAEQFCINRRGDVEPEMGGTYPLADLPQASLLQFAEPPIRTMREDIHQPQFSGDSEACYRKASKALDSGDFEAAAAQCEKFGESLVAGDEFGQCIYRVWAAAQLGLGHPMDARNVCDTGDRRGFGGAALEFERARALFELGELKEAIISATRSLALEWPEVAMELENEAEAMRYALRGQILAGLGEHSQAASMFDRALASDPGFGAAVLGKARAFEQLNLLDVALEGFLSGQGHPEIGQTCLKEAARIYSRLSLPKKSVALYREAWSRSQMDKEAWIGWKTAAEECGQLDETLAAFQAFSAVAELDANDWLEWGQALEESDQRFRALDAYQKSIALDPNVASAHFRLGNLLNSVDRKEQAAEAYEQALKLDEENADGWFVLGNLLADIGLLHGAKVSFLRGLSLAPDNAQAQKEFERICRAA